MAPAERGRRALRRVRELKQRLIDKGGSGWPADGIVRLGPDETSSVEVLPGRIEVEAERNMVAHYFEDEVADANRQQIGRKGNLSLGPFRVFYLV